MGLIYAIVVTLLFITAIISLILRESTYFTDNDIFIKNRCLKLVGITGSISCLMAWLNYYLWTEMIMSCSFIIMLLVMILSGISLILMLFMWSFAPSDVSKRKELEVHHIEYKQVNSFLKNYSIDKTLSVGNKKVSLCIADSILLIYEDNNTDYYALPFKSIIECEIVEDNSTVMNGGIGRAIVGAAIAGATGAIVGATTRKSKNVVNSLSVRIITNEIINPLYEISVISTIMDRNSEEYKRLFYEAQVVYSTVLAIINKN